MNNKINRYKIGLSIINNNRGLIAMLKTILNKCYNVLCNTIDKIGEYIYNVGYPTKSIKKKLKYAYVRLIRNNFILSNLRGFKHLWKLGDVVNGYVDYCKFKNSTRQAQNINKEKFVVYSKMITKLNTRIDIMENKHSLLDTPFKDDTPLETNTLKQIAKILSAYDNDGININVDDIVDDINDKFNGFNNIFIDICDDNNNINLGN